MIIWPSHWLLLFVTQNVSCVLVQSSCLFSCCYHLDSSLSEPLVGMMRNVVIPQIARLRMFEPLRAALSFAIYPKSSKGGPFVLDFFNIADTDAFGDAFKTK